MPGHRQFAVDPATSRCISAARGSSATTSSAVYPDPLPSRAGVWYDSRLERQLREEAPSAYKKVDEVMAAQQELTTVTRRLKPILVYKDV